MENFTCEAEVIRESDLSLLCRLETGDEVWVPKSVIHDDSEVRDDDENKEGEIVIKGWWAEKEGLL